MKHTGTVPLETERLILRRFTLNDAQQAFDNWMSREKVTRYMTWQPYQNVEDVKGYIQYVIGTYEKPDAYYWAIEEKNSGQVIGSISVIWLNEEVESAEVGYCLSDDFWGRGMMPEALSAVIRYLFVTVGLNRIQAGHDVNNPNSGRVMEKCGMRYEGTLRQADRNNQGVCDTVLRAILRNDYNNR